MSAGLLDRRLHGDEEDVVKGTPASAVRPHPAMSANAADCETFEQTGGARKRAVRIRWCLQEASGRPCPFLFRKLQGRSSSRVQVRPDACWRVSSPPHAQ